MKRLLLTLCLTTALHAQQPAAAPHTFTSTDGRKLTATLIEKTSSTVTLRRAEDGKDFTLQLDRLSAADQAFVKAWGTKPVPLVMADPALPESWVVPPKYVSARPFGRLPGTTGPRFSTFIEEHKDGLRQDRRIGLIRSDGLVLCDPDKAESLPPDFIGSYIDGSYSDLETANYFHYHRVIPKLSGGKYGLVDVDGKEVVRPQWDRVGSFSEGLFPCSVGGNFGYANLKGEMVVPLQWTWAGKFSGGYAVVRASKGGKQSVIDKTGKIISDAVWDDVRQSEIEYYSEKPYHVSVFDYRPAELPPGLFWVALNDKWSLYDMVRNASLGGLQWDKPGGHFQHGRAWVRKDGKFGMIDLTGKVVLEPLWEGAKASPNPLAPQREGNFIKVVKDGKVTWRHLNGTKTLPVGEVADSVKPYRGYFQLKIESGQLIRVEKNFRAHEPNRMVIRRGGKSELVGLAELDGHLLGEVQGEYIWATPSPDHFVVAAGAYADQYGLSANYGLIDASGKKVEPLWPVACTNCPLDKLQVSNPESLPDGEIVAAFLSESVTVKPDTLFVKTADGIVKVQSKLQMEGDNIRIEEALGTVTVKPQQKDGKWGYIRLIEAK